MTRLTHNWRGIFALIASLGFTSALIAQETAQSVLQKLVKAAGGLEKIRTVTSARCTWEFWSAGTEGRATIVEKWPSSSLAEYEFHNGTIRTISVGPRGADGKPRTLSLPVEEIFSGLVVYALDPDGKHVDYLGEVEEEGVPGILLKLTLTESKVTYYLDPATFLPFKILTERLNETSRVTYISGWRQNEGISLWEGLTFYEDGRFGDSYRNHRCVWNPVIDDAIFTKEAAK